VSDLMDRIAAQLREWRVGDPLNPANRQGALVDREHFEKVSKYLKKGKADGAKVIIGGASKDGYVEPTLLDVDDIDTSLMKDEVFGPVLAVCKITSLEEAIAKANDTQYGLAASIFTANGKKALRAARALKAGTVTVNCYGEGDVSTPFGGFKQSGFGGRENSLHAHDQYTELKTIWIDLSDRTGKDVIA
jgi:gamma-glutamyl-gamma-aminobutyraldehyde dehydrogenase